MPRKKETDDLIRVHVMMDRGDWQTWSALFEPNIGKSKALRAVMRDYLKRVERAVEEQEREAPASTVTPEPKRPQPEATTIH